MHRWARRRGQGRGGFTLVELVIVMSILGILVTIMVTAVQGVSNSLSVQATRGLFTAIDAALQRYFDDWGAYPWTSGDPEKKLAATGYNTGSSTYPEELVLFVALTTEKRRGPYFAGGADQTVVRKATSGTTTQMITLFADGWDRPIEYLEPPAAGQPPRLHSLGGDEADDDDDLYNY